MFLGTDKQEIINFRNIKKIYVKEVSPTTSVILADDFDNHSYCIYPIAGEGEINDKFLELVERIENQEILISL